VLLNVTLLCCTFLNLQEESHAGTKGSRSGDEGAAVCLPLSKLLMDQAYPFMVSNVNCGIDLTYEPWLWIVLYAAILLLYLVINRVLVGRLDRIVPAEVLKNRE